MRLVFMFGPMILRQVQKYQRNKQRQQYQHPRQEPMRQEPMRRRRETPPPPPREPQLSEEERNFKLKEEDIMLDKETIQDYTSSDKKASHEMDHESEEAVGSRPVAEDAPQSVVNEDDIVPSGKDKKEDDGFDLKDLFFEDEDGEGDQQKEG